MVLLLIDGGQYIAALVRMQDLNSATIQLKKKHPSLGRIQMLLPSEIEHLTDIKDSIIKEETSIFKVSDTRHVIQRLHDALSEIDSELKSQTINSKQ